MSTMPIPGYASNFPSSFSPSSVETDSPNVTLRAACFPGRPKYANVFEAIRKSGDDEHFEPDHSIEFDPTEAVPGSPEKLQILADRVSRGLPLWHPDDRVNYEGLTGALNSKSATPTA